MGRFCKCKKGSFKLIPKDNYLLILEKDYNNMMSMIYEADNKVTFDEIISMIREIEYKINNI